MADLYLDAYTDLYGSGSTSGGALSVTANAGGAASGGILLRVLVLDNATLPGSLNTVSQSGTGTHDASITPVYSGSRVFSAVLNIAAGGPPPASGNTAIDSVSDTVSSSAQAYGYGTYKSTLALSTSGILFDEAGNSILDESGAAIDDETGGGGGSAFLAGSTAANGGGLAALEVQPSGTISTDASSPPAVSSVTVGSGVTVVTTAGFRPPPGTLILALVVADGNATGTVTMSVADSYGLTWTEAVRANSAGNGYAGIWYTYAGAAPVSPLALPAATLPGANAGSPYTYALAASGGYPPYSYALASGSLPAGLTLASSGVISGTPASSGTSTFTVTVTDSLANTAVSGTQSLTVSSVAPATPYVLSSWTSDGAQYEYGTTTVGVATQDHDWILVVASWTDSQDRKAIAQVSDSSHNVYRPVGLNNSGYANIQAWVCPNAKAASKVYVSESAFVRNLIITVFDIRNMTAGYTLDVSAAPAAGSASAWTMSVTTTQPDLLIAAGTTTAVVTSLSAGWNAAGGGVSLSGGASQVVGAKYAASPGSVSATFGVAPAGTYSYAGLLFAFQANAAPVISSSNPAFPAVHVMAAFGYQPGNPVTLPTWTDISGRFWSLNGERGRSFELDELAAADLGLELDNFDGALSPGGSLGATLITPIQVVADWQGRRYSIASGLITALPQTYDFQRGIVKVALTDDYSKLPQILLPSCMISEQLYDEPLNLWPLNDATNAGQASNWSGRSTSVLVPVKGKYGGGVTGNTPTTGFGNQQAGNYPAGLEGTTDSCWGDFTQEVLVGGRPYFKGTSLVLRDEPNLPLTATGATYEFWALIEDNDQNRASGASLMVLTDEKGPNGAGDFLNVIATGLSVPLYVFQRGRGWNNLQTIGNAPNLMDSHWHHYAFTITTAGVVNIYIDGVLVGFFNGSFPSGTPNRLMFGGDVSKPPLPFHPTTGTVITSGSVNFDAAGFFVGAMSHIAVYDRVIDHERIQSHVQSGQTGFVGEGTGIRIQRVLQYARWSMPQAIEYGQSHMQVFNYLGGGYGSSGLSGAIGQYGTAGGAAGVDQGAQADITIQDIANSECGFLFVSADGTLTFRERDTAFNQAYTESLGDMDYAINQTTTFANGLGGWGNGYNCSVAPSSAWSYDGGQSLLITVTGTGGGSGNQAYPGTPNTAVTPGQVIGGSVWLMSPQGCYANLAFDYFNSSFGYVSGDYPGIFWLPPMTPVQVQVPPTSIPAGVAWVQFHPSLSPNPSTGAAPAIGTQLYMDHIRMSPAAFQVPYNGDLEITEDIQYLFNDIVVTRNIDQATYRARDAGSRSRYYPRVYLRTIYTAENDPQAVVDVANWLLDAYHQPQLRVSKVTVDAAANPEAWPFVLGTDIGDLVSFQRTPLGGTAVQGVFLVINVEIDWEAGDENTPPKAQFTYILAPPPGQSILTLDDPVYGLIGSTNELGW